MIVPFRTPIFDWAVVGREITRQESHSDAALGAGTPEHLRVLPGSRRAELDAFADLLASSGEADSDVLHGFRYFYDSDYASHRRDAW